MPRLAVPLNAAARRRPLVPVLVGVLLYSTGPVMVQASTLSGPVFSFWRLAIGAAGLAVAAGVGHRFSGRAWPTRRQWRWALWAGLAFGGHQLAFVTAIKLTTVADVSLMAALAPLLTAAGAFAMFSERPGRGFWAWTGVAIAGAAALALAAARAPAGNPTGMALAAANVGFFALFFLLSKRGRDDLAVLPFLTGVVLVAFVMVGAFVAVTGAPVGHLHGRDLLLAAGVALGPGALGHFVMTWPLRWVPANVPPVLRLGQPVLSGLLAWWALGEALSTRHLLAGAVVLAGAAGAVLSRDGRDLRAAAATVQPAGGTQTAGRTDRSVRAPSTASTQAGTSSALVSSRNSGCSGGS